MPLFLSAIQNPPPEIAGSRLWQSVFLSFALVLILFEIVRGWRLGIMRQLVRLAAVVAGYAAAIFGGELLVPLLRSYVKMPDIIISLIGGAILATAAYGIVAGLGTILFKRTAQQSAGPVRLVYGLGGALFGVGFGVFFVWLVLTGIRMVGSVADAQVRARPKPEANRNANGLSAQSPGPERTPSVADLNMDSVNTLLARLKNSVELGQVGELVKKTDGVPTGVQTLSEAGTVLADPEKARRFLDSPGARELTEHPKIVALRNDPEIIDMITNGRLLELLRDPRILDAMNDPTLAQQLKGFDMKKALDYAGKKGTNGAN